MRIAAVEAQEPMSGVTVLLGSDGSEAIAERVIASSRQLYAKKAKKQVAKKPKTASSSTAQDIPNTRTRIPKATPAKRSRPKPIQI